MADEDAGQEIELADEIQALNDAETAVEEPEPEEETVEEEEPEPGEDEIPEKYRGKSLAELARINEDLAKSNFKLLEERSQWRKQPEDAAVKVEQPAQPQTGKDYVRTLWEDEEVRNEAYPAYDLKYQSEMAKERRQLSRMGYEGDDLETELARVEGSIRFEAWAETLPAAESKVSVRRERYRAEIPAKVRTHAQRVSEEYAGAVTVDEVEQFLDMAGVDTYLNAPEERRAFTDRALVALILGTRQLNEQSADTQEKETPRTRATRALPTTGTTAVSGPRVSTADLNLAKEMLPELQNEDGSWDEEGLREFALSHKQTTKGR